MKHLTVSVAVMAIMGAQVGCGQNSVSFKESGSDANGFDVVLPVPGDENSSCPTCEGGDDGRGGLSGADVFVQKPIDGRVDILLIDDNSGSMYEEQGLLAQRFSTFIKSLNVLDWQIGITTTDVTTNPVYGLQGSILELANNPGSKILNKNFPAVENVFKQTIVRQETLDCETDPSKCASGNEQALYASILSMEKRSASNSGLFRNGADLAIVVLSDEDEMSDGPSIATKPKDVIDKFKSIWGVEKKLSVYGIIVRPGDSDCLNEQRLQSGGTGSEGKAVAELARLTGGLTGSICDMDYGPTLQKIGDKVLELNSAFELAHVPIASTVKVVLTPAQNIAHKVDGNKLIFASAPAPGTRIDVSYKH